MAVNYVESLFSFYKLDCITWSPKFCFNENILISYLNFQAGYAAAKLCVSDHTLTLTLRAIPVNIHIPHTLVNCYVLQRSRKIRTEICRFE